jgi:drug/metabolite transporter (DMT)-like permease
MKAREFGVLLLLAAIWGASFMFIKVILRDMGPLTLVALRMALGAGGLVVIYTLARRQAAGPDARPVRWRALLGPFVLAAILNAVIPYILISWGETAISSGDAAILNATTPLFTTIIGYLLGSRAGADRLPPVRALGVLIGFVGVAVLVTGSRPTGPAVDPALGWLGHGAVLVAAASYAVAGLYARRAFAGLPTLVPAVGQNVAAALILIPPTLVVAPLTHVPPPEVILSLLALGLGGTALAYVLYFHLISTVGATRTLLVTYLLPVTALIYGALLLGEDVGAQAVVGLALVLVGIGISTGGIGVAWRAARNVRRET